MDSQHIEGRHSCRTPCACTRGVAVEYEVVWTESRVRGREWRTAALHKCLVLVVKKGRIEAVLF